MEGLVEQSFIDGKDILILKVLEQDSRMSLRKIARRINMSPSAVFARIKRMEREGVIRRYTIDIDYERLGYTLPVIVDIRVSRGMLFEVEREVAKNKNVIAVYDVTGDFDITVLAKFKARSELDAFVKELQRMEFVERTNTKLILNVIAENKSLL